MDATPDLGSMIRGGLPSGFFLFVLCFQSGNIQAPGLALSSRHVYFVYLVNWGLVVDGFISDAACLEDPLGWEGESV